MTVAAARVRVRANLPMHVWVLMAWAWSSTVPGAASAQAPEFVSTRAQVRDAWLAADVVVFGDYTGVDSALGPLYHTARVSETWMGQVPNGRLVFKAPRGVEVAPGAQVLLLLWERLNAATDSYIETARQRYGEGVWTQIGSDSITTFLLPFSQYALPFRDGKIKLRSNSVFPEEVKRGNLRREMQELEYTLLPPQLYRRSDLVVHARVQHVDRRNRVIEGVAVEYRVYVDFEPIEVIKGSQPDSLKLAYSSFPRSPRFDRDEQVILFLSRAEDGFILEPGKRAVYHVRDGTVGETGQPLRAFIQSLHTEGR